MSDLIEKAMEAFNALSSEQQAEMLEETRKSFAENNVALSRPAAPVEGLEVVAYQYKLNDAWYLSDAPETLRKAGYELREVVTRENAEAVTANVEAEKAKAIREAGKHFAKTCMMAEEIETLEADNAALTARVKELEHDLNGAKGNAKNAMSNVDYWQGQTKALETQLAAARKDAETWEANFKALNAKYAARAALEGRP